MLIDALRSFRRSFAPLSRQQSPQFRTRRPVTSAERLEDRALLSAVNQFQTFHGVDWTSVGAGGISHNLDSEGWTPPEGGWGQATLSVDGVHGTVTKAYLYWHGVGTERSGDFVGDADDVFNEPNTYDNETIFVDGQSVVGVSLGRGPAPDQVGVYRGESQSFRADVTELVRAGLAGSTDGTASFQIANLSAKQGHSADGVSLVVVYDDGDAANDRDLYLLDGNAVASSAASRWLVHLPDFLYRRGDVRAQLHVADGQWIPTSAPADPPLTFQTRLGANYPVRIPDTDSLFDGLVPPADLGWFGGNRWDVHTFDISAAFSNPAAGPGEHYLSMSQSWFSTSSYEDSLALVALIYDTAAADPGDPPPIANDLSAVVKLGSYVDGTLPATDPSGDRLTFEMIPGSGPSHGSAYVSRNGYFSYKSNGIYIGMDSFRYRVFDGNNWAEATVYLTIRENTPPELSDQTFSGLEDVPFSAQVIGQDGDGDTLQFTLVTSTGGPAFGTVQFNSDGTFLYTPDANFHGTDTFLVKASDGEAESAVVTVTITITAVNDRPVLVGRKLTTAEDASLTFAMGGADVDGDSLSYVIDVVPSHGTLSRNANGSYTYLPSPNYSGNDSFSVRASDGQSYSDVATFTIGITPVNDPPTVPAQTSHATGEDTPLLGRVEGFDVDGDTLMYVLEQPPEHGTLLFDEATGEFIYTPETNYHGPDSFRYVAGDGRSVSGTGTIAVSVAAVNDVPTFSGASFSVRDNSPAGTHVGIVAGTDADSDALAYSITAGNATGHFAIDPLSGAITVARSGLDHRSTPEFELTVTVSDGNGGTASAVVIVTVRPVSVAIDIKPSDAGNVLDSRADKLVPVAILSTASFDATQIDVASLTFGLTGDEASLSVHPKKGARFEYRDVDGDGRLDLVAYFDLALTGLGEGDTTATLKGKLSDGTDFVGTDAVTISSSSKGKGGPKKK